MSETDDIFDIDEFLKNEKVVPPYIYKAWEKHVKFFNALELRADKHGAILLGLKETIEALKRAGIL